MGFETCAPDISDVRMRGVIKYDTHYRVRLMYDRAFKVMTNAVFGSAMAPPRRGVK